MELDRLLTEAAACEALGLDIPCRVNPDLPWTDAVDGRPGTGPGSLARRCEDCPVLDLCLDYALRNDVSGVWGGTSHAQRKRLRAERGIEVTAVWRDVAAILGS